MIIKLAWRNLWRNKRRTIITLASVFFAVVLSTLMMSLKEGVYSNMIDSMVGAYSGYAQIHHAGYQEDKNLDNSLQFSDSLIAILDKVDGLVNYAPRIESFALAASDKVTKGSMVVGIDPQKEIVNTGLDERVSDGEYLSAEDKAVMIGAGLAEYLKVGVGDTLVLLGQGYHGVNAAGKYPIKGIVKFGSPELSKQLVFLPIKAAQWLYDYDGMATNIVLIPEEPLEVERLVASLKPSLGDTYEVMAWQELNPELINMIETDRVEGYVFMFILYLVISFGIFGTMLMMLAERQHEFGIMVAVGMRRMKLGAVVFIEIVSLSILGAILGMMGAFPICAYFFFNPIKMGGDYEKMYEEYGMEAVMSASIEPFVFIDQAVVIAVLASFIGLYAFVKLAGMKVIMAMRN